MIKDIVTAMARSLPVHPARGTIAVFSEAAPLAKYPNMEA
jgi:hypothetical protein